MMMNNFGWIFGSISLLIAFTAVFFERRKVSKTMKRIDTMLSDAMDGNFSESDFDESMLSALETRFAHYISASKVSAQNLKEEKEHINTLIADISHQTKTPIANLLLYTELVKEENLSSKSDEYIDIIYSQTQKLQFLIDSLVKLSRLENGIVALHPKEDLIFPMLEEVKEQFLSKAEEKGLKLILKPTDASACFDYKWTAEALCNLVDNAIKYTEKGSVVISVVCYEMFIRIDVKDTGAGIPEQEQPKIFSRFYRSESNFSQDGVGIGLHLAGEILKNEGGYIKVSSEVNKGSVFSLSLKR